MRERSRLARYVAAGLAEQLRAALGVLSDRRLPLALLLLAVLLTLAAQVPRTYTVEIGQEDGPGADLPLVGGFYPPEQNAYGNYRWSGEEVAVDLPGVGQRPLDVTIAVMGLPQAVQQAGPQEVEPAGGGWRFCRSARSASATGCCCRRPPTVRATRALCCAARRFYPPATGAASGCRSTG